MAALDDAARELGVDRERLGDVWHVRFREAVLSTWPAYLDGERTLNQAATDLVRALGAAEDPDG